MQEEVPKGPRKARQSRPGGACAGLGPDPEPSWGSPAQCLRSYAFGQCPRRPNF